MMRSGNSLRGLAFGLSALAGFVDATGFLASGGFFVSFMTGNSTQMAVALGTRQGQAGVALLLIAAFVAGVALFARLARTAARPRAGLIALVGVVLAAAAGLAVAGQIWAALALTALAMGGENVAFDLEEGSRISLTYMTGTLVKLGERLATGGWAWLVPLLQFLSLLAGAVGGAALFGWLGPGNLWVAAVAALVCAGVARRLDRAA